MTETASNAAPMTPRAAMRLLLGCAVAMGIVVLAIGPGQFGAAMVHAPPIHPHAPDLSLLSHVSPAIRIHLVAVLIALAIGAGLLIGVKGRKAHRVMGWIWVVSMMIGAVSSLFIKIVNHGHLSLIHLLAGWVIIALPVAVFAARKHRVRMHARFMTGLFTGGLVLAGAMAFSPGRLMWDLFLR
jgi:uncharacterized membrane protein